MPVIKSAKKRVRTAHKAAVRNSLTKRSLKSALKVFGKSPSAKTHNSAQSQLDKALKKGVIHKNKAKRLKKQAANRAKAAGVKAATAKAKAAVKASAKATSVKKTVKAAAKKTAAKKPAAKK